MQGINPQGGCRAAWADRHVCPALLGMCEQCRLSPLPLAPTRRSQAGQRPRASATLPAAAGRATGSKGVSRGRVPCALADPVLPIAPLRPFTSRDIGVRVGAGVAPSLPAAGTATRPRSPLCTPRSSQGTEASQRPRLPQPHVSARSEAEPLGRITAPRALPFGPGSGDRGQGAQQGPQHASRPGWPSRWPRSPSPLAALAELRRG